MGKCHQYQVAYLMSEGIVIVFKVIKVNLEQYVVFVVALRTDNIGLLAEAASIGNACEVIRYGGLFQTAVHAFNHEAVVDTPDHFAELEESEFQDHEVITVEQYTSA